MRTIAVIAGATATGKSDLAERLAGAIGGEVVCADARQLFRDLEIGTGKPSPLERAARPHHLFDALALGGRASAGGWARSASGVCDAVFARGNVPVLVGGSGLYLRALIEGLHAVPPRDERVRERLRSELDRVGIAALHARLATADPAAAASLAPGDTQRVCRALEVFESSGRPLSWWQAQSPRAGYAADWRVLELTCAPRALAARIEHRTHAMFEGRLVQETQALLSAGFGPPLSDLRAIGYDEAMLLLAGTIGRAEAESRTNARTRQLAKRQRTWFRHQLRSSRLASDETRADDLLRAARDALLL